MSALHSDEALTRAVVTNTAAAPLQQRFRLHYYGRCISCSWEGTRSNSEFLAKREVDAHNADHHEEN